MNVFDHKALCATKCSHFSCKYPLPGSLKEENSILSLIGAGWDVVDIEIWQSTGLRVTMTTTCHPTHL